ncbi:MAG TPA: hypothetical protein VKN74_02790 [Candidatus Mcinerneyibacterium sp.]|nr:hypothetical protein [Candidatus Mcinerneyibacterium sp.]
MSETIFVTKNYKKLQNEEFVIGDNSLIIVNGKNRVGKTSFLTAIIELYTATRLSSNPVTKGEKKGVNTLHNIKINGKLYTIIHSFDENKSTFKLIDEETEQKITKKTDIREILGQYTNISVDDFFQKAKSLPGRKEIINNFINPLLSPENRKNILDSKNRIEEYKEKRKDINKIISRKEGEKTAYEITEKDKKYLSSKDDIIKQIDELKKINETHNITETIISIKNKIREIIDLITNSGIKFNSLNYYVKKSLAIEEDLNSRITPDYKKILDENNKRIEKGNEYLTTIKNIEEKQEKLKTVENKIKEKKEEVESLNRKIEKEEDKIKKIYKEGKLPSNIETDGEDFVVEGLNFEKENISESQAYLLLLEILCKMDNSPIRVVGNISLFDEQSLEEAKRIADKEDKILFFENVTTDDFVNLSFSSEIFNDLHKNDNSGKNPGQTISI